MLVDWVVSLILIFVLQYIAIFIINFNNVIVDALNSLINDVSQSDGVKTVYNKITVLAITGMGMPSLTATLVYCMITFMTISFFIAYVNRMIKVAFLIIISPLISITYSIDKMKDQKAQAFDTWFKELTFTILIQPFHCIMYFAFTNTAFALLEDVTKGNYLTNALKSALPFSDTNMIATAVLAVASLLFIKQAENVVRKIFGFKDSNKSTSMAAGMAVGVLAVRNAKKIGTATRKGINTTKRFAEKIGPSIMSDANKFKNSKLGNKIGDKLSKASDAFKDSGLGKGYSALAGGAGNAFNKVSNSAFGKSIKKARGTISKTKDGVSSKFQKFKGTKLGRFINPARTLGSTASIMTGMIALMDGNSPIEALGEASAMKEGVNTFINTSEKRLADDSQQSNAYIDEAEYDRISDSYNTQISNTIKNEGISVSSIDEFEKKAQKDYEENDNKTYNERLDEKKEEANAIKEKAQKRGYYTDAEKEEEERLEEEINELEKYAKVESLINERDDALDDFMSDDKAVQRALDRMREPSKKDIKKAVDELQKEILRIKTERRKRAGNNTSNLVTEEDSKTAKSMTKTMEDIIARSVYPEAPDVDLRNMLEEYLGASDEEDPAVFNDAIEKAAVIKQLYSQKHIARNAQVADGVNGSRERMAAINGKRSAANLRHRHRSKKK